MTELKEGSKRLNEELLRQNFWDYTKGNGEIIMVSEDKRYFYKPTY